MQKRIQSNGGRKLSPTTPKSPCLTSLLPLNPLLSLIGDSSERGFVDSCPFVSSNLQMSCCLYSMKLFILRCGRISIL